MKTWVYKHFDEAGVLLYVGISDYAFQRCMNHQVGSHWFDEVRRIDVLPFPSREEAMNEEGRLILALRPKHNHIAVVDGKLTRLGAQEILRKEYLEKRPAMIAEINLIGFKTLSSLLGVTKPTLMRMFDEDSTPLRPTIDKFDEYFQRKEG